MEEDALNYNIYDPESGVELIHVEFTKTNKCDCVIVDIAGTPTYSKTKFAAWTTGVWVGSTFLRKNVRRGAVRVKCSDTTHLRILIKTTFGQGLPKWHLDNGYRIYDPSTM